MAIDARDVKMLERTVKDTLRRNRFKLVLRSSDGREYYKDRAGASILVTRGPDGVPEMERLDR